MLKKYYSMRLIFAFILMIAIAIVGFAANFSNIKIFDVIKTQAEETPTTEERFENIIQPMLTLGTCDTAGPIEVESSGGTTAPTAYGTLTAAFNAINAGTHQNVINIEVCAGSVEPAGSAVLNSTGAGSASYTQINIYPLADSLTISGASATGKGVIELNGADNVTIDGDNSLTAGTNRNLTITNTAANTTTLTSVIRLATIAATVTSTDNVTIKNLNLNGSATDGNSATNNTTTGSENNTFGIYAGGNASGAITAPAALTSVTSNTAPSGTTINSFNVSNNTLNACARAIYFNGAASTVSTGVTISNNLVGDQSVLAGNPPYTTPIKTVYTKGIYVQGTDAVTISGNSVRNILSYVDTLITGIELDSNIGAGTINISNNTVNGVVSNSVAGTSSVDGIVVSSAGGPYTIKSNTVTNIQLVSTSSNPKPRGIEVGTSAASGTIEKNRVSSIYNRSTGTGGVYGINLASGNNITVQNNFVWDINQDMTAGTAFSTTTGTFGIRAAGGTGHKIYHNSVNLFGTQFGTAASGLLTSAFAIGGTGQTDIDVRNNIFSNKLIGGTSSIAHVSMYLPSSGTSAMNLTLNNNDYSSGTTSEYGIAHVGTTYTAVPAGPATFAGLYTATNFDAVTTASTINLRAYTSTLSSLGTNDNSTKVVNPLFVSDTNLHIQSGSTMVGMGANVSVIDDIDGQTRPAINPAIGADELPPAVPGTLQFSLATYSVGETGSMVTLTVSRTGGSDGAVTVGYALANVSATGGAPCAAGIDFVNTGGTVSFANGETSKTFDVAICDDTVFEGNETFTSTLSNATGGATIGTTATTTVTINDNEVAMPGTLAFNSANYSGIENTMATITVTRTAGSTGAVSVNFATSNGTATGGTNCTTGIDYVITNGTLNFANGETTKTFNVNLCSDLATEGNETVNLALSNVTGGATIGANNTAVLTITDVPVPLNGTYTVGTGGDYPSLTNTGGIFSALNNQSASGNITINIISDLTGETGVAALNEIAGGFTVIIKPIGAARSITGSSASSLIKLSGADGVTIDGSLSGGTDRSLSVTNTGTGAIIWFAANATSGANNDTIKNTVLIGSGNFDGQGIVAGSGAVLGNPSEFSNSGNTIQNNAIRAVQNAAFINGNATTSDQNWSITGNEIGSTTVADKLSLRGVYLSNSNNFTISRNLISGINSATASTSTMSGIHINGNINGGTITRNEIKDIRQNNIVGFGSNGIFLDAATTGSNLLVANNFISDIASQGFGGTAAMENGYGITINSGGGYNIYFNTVNMNTNQTAAGSITAAVNITSSVTTVGAINLRNNVLADTQTVGTRYAVINNSTQLATVFTDINYNDYFAQNVGLQGTTVYPTLLDWQGITTRDANSQAVDPIFVSATNLHLQTTSPLSNDGTPIAGITVDFDGETRSATIPEIGADEFVVFGTLVLSSTTYAVGESAGTATITVNRTVGTDGAVTVNYALSNGTATGGATCVAGVDYLNAGGTVSFANGEATKTFNVSICPDAVDELNETFNVTLSTPTGGAVLGTPITAVVTIIDDDLTPSLSINDVSQVEGDSGTSIFAFTVSLSGASSQTITVDYQTANGTATVANSDYVALPVSTLTFMPGETTKTVNVTVNGDVTVESNETFFVNLSNATTATILDNQGIGTIQNDDIPTLSIGNINQIEGNSGTSNFTFTVTLSKVSNQTVTVNYQTADGTATVAGNDYNAASGTLSFAPGVLTRTLAVVVKGDTAFEFNETFFVNLSNATNATIFDNQAVGLIINEDSQSLRIGDVRINEGNSGGSIATFTVTLTPNTNRPEGASTAVTVSYQTVNFTAVAGFDYRATDGTLTFNPGETQKIIQITIFGDTTKEATETFSVDLFNAVNASISEDRAFGVIVDEDHSQISDFDRDKLSDYNVYRPDTSVWYIFQSTNGIPKITPLGSPGDIAVPGDYDGDLITDVAVYRPSNGNWYILQSQGESLMVVNWGIPGDKPVQADYDGDGKTDTAMFRPSDGKWYIIRSTNNTRPIFQFGSSTDLPVIGDFDGDFKNDLTVFRNGVWYVLRSSDSRISIANWGITGDKAVSGDFDGDGKTDYTVYRNGTWWIYYSLRGTFSAVNWGLPSDIPAPADYDGDGKSDITVFRPSEGNWYVLRSSDASLSVIKWGKSGDVPGPAAYTPQQ